MKRIVLLAGLCVAPVLFLVAPAWAEGAREQEPLTLNVGSLKGPTGVGLVKMLEDRPSLGEGVDTEYTVVGSPDLLVSRVLSGEVDFAALPANVAAKLYNGGVDYQLAAIHVWGVLYVLENGDTVQSWADLEGRAIGSIGRGATPDVVFRYLAERAGVDPESDLEIRYYPHMELTQLLVAGRESLAVLAEPFVTKALMANPSLRIALDMQEKWAEAQGGAARLAMGTLVVRGETVRRNPELVETFLEHYRESIEWVNANPAEAGRLVEKHEIGFTAEEAEAAIPRSNIRYGSAQESRDAVESYLEALLEYAPGSIGGSLPDDGFYLAP